MLSPNLLFILLLVALLLLCVLGFLYLILRNARKRPGPKEVEVVPAQKPAPQVTRAPDEFTQFAPNLKLQASFIKALRLLKRYVTGKDYRYRIPWFLMMGEARSGKTSLLTNVGLNAPLGTTSERVYGTKQGLNWSFFDKAVVLDVAGDYVLREDGETSNNRSWNAISKLLQKYRPERPLDGIILTIPCTDLLGARHLTPENRLRLERKATALYKKLWQAQKILGMSFPVYVIVTKCDEVTGFKSLCKELPEPLRENIFGWSSPYTLETAYNSSWVSEAFQNLYRYLFQIQAEVFAESNEMQDGDGLFLLPSEMQALRAPLQIYLDNIFKESSYHNSFFFRGLYFCGDGESAPAPPPAPPMLIGEVLPEDEWDSPTLASIEAPQPVVPLPSAKRPIFLKHLFEKKIFQEDLLARPVSKIMLSRNRTVLTCQVLSLLIPLIGGIGLLATYSSLERREKELHEFLLRESQDLARVSQRFGQMLSGVQEEDSTRTVSSLALTNSYRPVNYYAQPRQNNQSSDDRNLFDLDAPPIRDEEEELLAGMAKIGGARFYSVFIPSSWFSGVNRRIETSIVAAFRYVILDSLRLELENRTKDLLAAPVYERSLSSNSTGANPTNSDSIYAHPRPPKTSATPEADSSDSVRPTYQLHKFVEDLGLLIINRTRYERLRQKGTGTFEDINSLVEYLGHAPLPSNFDKNNELFLEALKSTEGAPLSSNDVHRRGALKVEEMIEGIYQGSYDKRSVSYDYLSDISETEALLAKPEYTWLSTYVFNPRSPFHDMTISSGLRELRKSLEGLSRQKFMSKDGYTVDRPEYKFGRRLIWDKERLRQAIALYQDYARFIDNRGYNTSQDLDASVRQAALRQLRIKISKLIAEAKVYQSAQPMVGESIFQAKIVAEVKNFDETKDLLVQLMEICERLNIKNELSASLIEQASYLVRAIGREFMKQNFYTPIQGDFSWWNGTKPLSVSAFDVGNPEELMAYLSVQRKRILFLGRELALPIFTFMATQNVSYQVLQADSPVDWDEILTELDRYDNKVPGNSVMALENFIRYEMDRIDIEDCSAMIRQTGGASNDFFIQRRNALRRQLYGRCEELAQIKILNDNIRALSNYREIEEAFNRTLAGRFPFSDPGDNISFYEADPDTIADFFQLLDRKEKSARDALLLNPSLGQSQASALEFLDRLDEVRIFFNSFLDKKHPPVFDFDFRFRTNQSREIGANQIIDWKLDVGRKRFDYLTEEHTGSWLFGDPIRLSLRWANDSPSIPMPSVYNSRVKVKDRTAILEFNNRWSLLYFLIKHAGTAADFDQGVDVEPYTLKFMIRTRPDTSPPAPVQRAQSEELIMDEAQVYMRVGLIAPSKKEPLILPSFPAIAPKLPVIVGRVKTTRQ
ncbi:MAG: hypothetical protein ICV60_09715 [Pyrinomonadaceae bacterium]|nr:hypothetical protein [Pyrinomonadaceae bacterium]